MERTTNSILQHLDLEIQKMDTISMNISYSNLIQSRFTNYREFTSHHYLDKLQNAKQLMDLFVSINGPLFSVKQVNLYNFDGQFVGAGITNNALQINLDQQDWYTPTLEQDGRMYLSRPSSDTLFTNSPWKKEYYLSLYRLYRSNYGKKLGIIETTQDCRTIFGNIDDVLGTNINSPNVFVFDSSGFLIYPYNISDELHSTYSQYYNYIEQSKPGDVNTFSIPHSQTNSNEMLSFNVSDYTNWTILTTQSENIILKPIKDLLKMIIFIAVLMFLFSLALSYYMAKTLTDPIKKIRSLIRHTKLNTLGDQTREVLNSDVNELDDLHDAFQKMSVKLKTSMDELLTSRQQENKARMEALQSQINPHFYYNSMASIIVMAEANRSEEIITLGQDLSFLMRYITSEQSSLVTLEREIDYVRKYLSCMKVRYQSSLTYDIHIDDEMLDIELPKLIIQPLVENALKHGTQCEPPWHISINGRISNNSWDIRVSDNGAGFSHESLQKLEKQILNIENKDLTPDLKIDGMGLLNTYLRWKLHYKEKAIFQISNLPDSGAIITIGKEISNDE
ncbi:MAG TPA: histidine kinase [Epulopiscium sp.]|nr:histidine kinase [Candidatus Epulonipiscium sp.]